jgi:hypothetical protein
MTRILIYFLICLKALLAVQTMQCQLRRLRKNESVRIGEEAKMTIFNALFPKLPESTE